MIHSSNEEWKEAKELLEKAISLEAENYSLYKELGEVCEKLDDVNGATTAFEKALEFKPGDLEHRLSSWRSI